MAGRVGDKVRSFGQFDQGAGTAAARRGKPKPSAPAASAAPSSSPAPRGPSAEDKLRQDAKDYRKRVLQGSAGKQKNQGAPGAGEGRHG